MAGTKGPRASCNEDARLDGSDVGGCVARIDEHRQAGCLNLLHGFDLAISAQCEQCARLSRPCAAADSHDHRRRRSRHTGRQSCPFSSLCCSATALLRARAFSWAFSWASPGRRLSTSFSRLPRVVSMDPSSLPFCVPILARLENALAKKKPLFRSFSSAILLPLRASAR